MKGFAATGGSEERGRLGIFASPMRLEPEERPDFEGASLRVVIS